MLVIFIYFEHVSGICLGGVMVSVPATGPKVHGFKHIQGDESLRVIKIHSTPSFRGEVKPQAPCHKFVQHVKNLA
jgi:hypothetical protein